MDAFTWVVMIGIAGAIGYSVWRLNRNWQERTRAAEARMTSFVAQAMPRAAPTAAASSAAAPAPPPGAGPGALAQQKLLFEAASKAAEAGEPVLAIQIYARLLSRYPDTGLAGQARAAVETQKKRLAKR